MPDDNLTALLRREMGPLERLVHPATLDATARVQAMSVEEHVERLRDALRELHEAIEQYGVGSLRELAPLFRAMTQARALLEEHPHA